MGGVSKKRSKIKLKDNPKEEISEHNVSETKEDAIKKMDHAEMS